MLSDNTCVHSDYEHISIIIIIHYLTQNLDRSSYFMTSGTYTFNMDNFNVIQINPCLLRANLMNDNDINNYIKYYSQQTQTSWCVLN